MKNDLEVVCAEAMIEEVFKMKRGETLAITADQGSNFAILEEFLNVANENGVQATILKTATPEGQSKAAENTIPKEALTQFLLNVDCWLDAGSKGLLYSNIFEEVMAKNKRIRYMLIADLSTEILHSMYCSFNVDKMVELTTTMIKMLSETKRFTMKDGNGTDITFEMDPEHWLQADNGDAGKPGLYTPPALVNIVPRFGTTNGILAFKGIYADPEPNMKTEEPVFVHVIDGVIEKIEGDETGSREMMKWYEKFEDDPNAHKVAHINFGLLPGHTEITGYVVMDERLWGCANWGFGHVSAYDAPPDGQDSMTHIDAICEKISVWFDHVLIMEDGNFVHPELKKIADTLAK